MRGTVPLTTGSPALLPFNLLRCCKNLIGLMHPGPSANLLLGNGNNPVRLLVCNTSASANLCLQRCDVTATKLRVKGNAGTTRPLQRLARGAKSRAGEPMSCAGRTVRPPTPAVLVLLPPPVEPVPKPILASLAPAKNCSDVSSSLSAAAQPLRRVRRPACDAAHFAPRITSPNPASTIWRRLPLPCARERLPACQLTNSCTLAAKSPPTRP